MESTFDALSTFFQSPDVQRGLVLLGFKSAVILGLAALAAYVLREASAARRHLVWAMALGSVLLLPVLELALPAWRVALVEAAAPLEAVHLPVPPPPLPAPDLPPLPPPAPPIAPEAPMPVPGAEGVMTAANGSSDFSLPPLAWLGLLWIAGAAAVALYYLVGLVRLNGWAGRAEPVADDRVRQSARDVAWELDVSRPVALRWTDDAVTPLTFGVVRPVVLMPRAAEEWDDDRLRVVLLHEFAHIRRLDALTQMVAQAATALFWFNPLVWWSAHRLRVERERACDDYVLARGTRASAYAAHLLEIARSLRGRAPGFAVSMAHRGELEGRLLAILEPERRREILTRAVTVVAGVAFAAVLLPLAAFKPWHAQAQPLVTIYEVPPPPMPEDMPGAAAPSTPEAPPAPMLEAEPIPGSDVIRRSFDVRPGGRLEIRTDVGSITVEPWRSDRVEVEVEHDLEDFNVNFDQRGSTVSVRGERERRSSWWGRSQKARFRVRVPERFNVNLNTSGGSISVGDLEGEVAVRTSGGSLSFGYIRGAVQGRTSGGSIQVARATGDVDVRTSGGSIRLGAVGGTVNAHTSGGSITLDEVGGDVRAKTSGGAIEATITRQPRGESRLETSGGSVSVRLADGVNLDLEARTSSGRVTSDFHPEHRRRRGGGDVLQGKIGRGGPLLYLRTSAGGIRVSRMNRRSSGTAAEPRGTDGPRQRYSYSFTIDDDKFEQSMEGLGESLSEIITTSLAEAFASLESVDWKATVSASADGLSEEEIARVEIDLEEALREIENARREVEQKRDMREEARRASERALQEAERALRESERAIREARRAQESRGGRPAGKDIKP